MEQWKKSYLEKQELCDILMPYYFSTAQRKAGLLPAAASSSAGAAGAAVSRGCSTILLGPGTAASSVCLLHPSVGTVGREGAGGGCLAPPCRARRPHLALAEMLPLPSAANPAATEVPGQAGALQDD